MKNIILVGYMACGKSSIKKELEKKYDIEGYDTDEVIEKMQGLKIADIFEIKGEKYFRELETKVIKELVTKKNNDSKGIVIATGGGLPVKNKEILKNTKTVIYLRATKETIVQRVENDKTRPLLANNTDDLKKLEIKVENMLKERNPIYEEIADIIIDVDNKNINDIIGEIETKCSL